MIGNCENHSIKHAQRVKKSLRKRLLKMARQGLTDKQVEQEIEKLKNSPYVKLARKEEQLRYRRRKYLYTLRQYERMGKELENSGITFEVLEQMEKEM